MRTFIILGLLTTGVHLSFAQTNWTTPVPLTTGDHDNFHPTIANGELYLFSEEELLAFSRNGRNICVLRTTNNGEAWVDSVYYVTRDSANNDFPSLAGHLGTAMLVWQASKNGNLDIYYSTYNQSMWTAPQAVTTDAEDDMFPHVTLGTDRYYLTWERRGRILFSEYGGTSWSPAQTVSQLGDTLNHHPQVGSVHIPSTIQVVIWEKRKEPDTTYALMCAYRDGTAWTTSDTLVSTGDNRRPRFFKYDWTSTVQWERLVQGGVRCYSGHGHISGGRFQLDLMGLLIDNSTEYQRNISVNGLAVITSQHTPQSFPYIVAAWESPTLLLDSIGVVRWPTYPLSQRLGASNALSNRNPDVSQGMGISSGRVRVWVVWEALVYGKWQLYASNTIVSIPGAVDDANHNPGSFALMQNYPNPFNPSTRIQFKVRGSGLVSLKVYDVLGREIATLVNELVKTGNYEETFNASGMASGTYFYQLCAPGFAQTRKLMVVK